MLHSVHYYKHQLDSYLTMTECRIAGGKANSSWMDAHQTITDRVQHTLTQIFGARLKSFWWLSSRIINQWRSWETKTKARVNLSQHLSGVHHSIGQGSISKLKRDTIVACFQCKILKWGKTIVSMDILTTQAKVSGALSSLPSLSEETLSHRSHV